MWRQRRFAELWKVAKLIVGKKQSFKMRAAALPPASSPSAAEWREFLAGPGHLGGCSAMLIDEGQSDNRDGVIHVSQADEVAAEVMLDIATRESHTTSCRKTPPAGEVPNELWRMILNPEKLYKIIPSGIGYENVNAQTTLVVRRLRRVFALSSAVQRAPRAFNTAQASR